MKNEKLDAPLELQLLKKEAVILQVIVNTN